MSMPISRLSCTMRLMGAESGLTTASSPLRGNIVSVSDVDEFQVAAPYSMFWICSRIFSISDLRSTTTFAMSAFWHLEPMVFASRFELLNQEVRLAADRGTTLKHLAQLGNVAAQAHRLLINGDMVGKNGCLGNDACLVNIGRGEHRLEFLAQARLIGGCRFGSGRFYARHQRLDARELFGHVRTELFTLTLTHLVIIRQCLLRQLNQAGTDLILIRLRLFHGQDVRKTHERHERHVVFQIIAHGERVERVNISAQQRLVHTQDGVLRLRGVDRDEHVQLAAADVLLDGGFDRVLGEEEVRGMRTAISK